MVALFWNLAAEEHQNKYYWVNLLSAEIENDDSPQKMRNDPKTRLSDSWVDISSIAIMQLYWMLFDMKKGKYQAGCMFSLCALLSSSN